MSESEATTSMAVSPAARPAQKVVRTYGRPKPAANTEPSSSSSSDLTSLSQLSGLSNTKRNDSGYFGTRAVDERESPPVEKDVDLPKHRSVADEMAALDARFDSIDDDVAFVFAPAPPKLFTSTPATRDHAALQQGDDAREGRSPTCSSPVFNLQRAVRSSTPAGTTLVQPEKADVEPLHPEEDEEAEIVPIIRRPTHKAPPRPKYDKTIHSSEDEQEDESASPKKLPTKTGQDRLFLSDDEDAPVAAGAKKQKQNPLLPLSDDSDTEHNTSQRTEEIEHYGDDSQLAQSVTRGLGWNEPKLAEEDSPDAKRKKAKAPRQPSKKDLDAIHAVEAAQRRSE